MVKISTRGFSNRTQENGCVSNGEIMLQATAKHAIRNSGYSIATLDRGPCWTNR